MQVIFFRTQGIDLKYFCNSIELYGFNKVDEGKLGNKFEIIGIIQIYRSVILKR